MSREKTEIYCAECGTWLVIEGHDGSATCDCGSQFSITATPVPDSSPAANRTPSPRGHPVQLDLVQRTATRR